VTFSALPIDLTYSVWLSGIFIVAPVGVS